MNPTQFFDAIRSSLFYGNLTEPQVSGINTILLAWSKLYPNTDPRFIAYSLATTYWETGRTMQPIEEIGHGKGMAYGAPTGAWHQVYDGRGDVQLTWYANYDHAGQRLHAMGFLDDPDALVKDPSLVMLPEVAAGILVLGMTEGWFTGKKLSDYFSTTSNDPVNARRIINGLDHSAQLGIYYEHFLKGLQS